MSEDTIMQDAVADDVPAMKSDAVESTSIGDNEPGNAEALSTTAEATPAIDNDAQDVPAVTSGQLQEAKIDSSVDQANIESKDQAIAVPQESMSSQTPENGPEQINPTGVPHTVPAPAIQESSIPETPAIVAATRDSRANDAASTNKSTSATKATSGSGTAGGDRPLTGSPARVYLKEHVNDYLLEGMKWLALTRPSNGLLALGQYLCSADAWRQEPKHATKSIHEFHSYWLSYQQWLTQGNAGKTEQEYRSTL